MLTVENTTVWLNKFADQIEQHQSYLSELDTPVVQAVQAGELTQDVIDDAVASTEPMVAKKGRASYLGERSVGHLDPGAVSSGYLFTTLLDTEGIL
ncbi:hypothetical protein ABB42_04485 [Lactiplantibacillus plantarum]|nr:DAK2 domain-containing protein [Lactiplantibacillus plantarum]KWT52975.1 hypothetical protein ABB42_04485 [Lactiplantibacillus plantarum]